jgi:hypothetical protein
VASSSPVPDAELFALLARAGDGAAHREQKSAKADGLFPAGAKGKALVAAARARGLIESCPDPNAPVPRVKGKAPKLTHVKLTAAGREQLFQHLSPKAALEALHRLLESRQSTQARGDEAGPLAAQVGELRTAVDRLQAELASAASRRRDEAAEWQRLLGVVEGKVAEAVIQTRAHTTPGPTPAVPDDRGLEGEAVRFVGDWSRDRGHGCRLDELKAHLDAISPGLTVGAFHDLLRRLHNTGQVRLTGWGQTLDEIPRPDLALFVSHKVMYYVHPGDRAP